MWDWESRFQDHSVASRLSLPCMYCLLLPSHFGFAPVSELQKAEGGLDSGQTLSPALLPPPKSIESTPGSPPGQPHTHSPQVLGTSVMQSCKVHLKSSPTAFGTLSLGCGPALWPQRLLLLHADSSPLTVASLTVSKSSWSSMPCSSLAGILL